MGIFRVLDKIENAMYNSQKLPWPMYDWTVIHREKFLALIEKSRAALPEEMKQARWISRENQRIIQEAKEKADKIIKDAESRAMNILKEAREESLRLIDQNEKRGLARRLLQEMLKWLRRSSEEKLNTR